jgi:DNA polymerase
MDRPERIAMLMNIYREYAGDPAFDSLRSHGPAKRVVPGRGSMFPRFVIVGEAPGQTEARKRKPFQGPAGHVLTGVLASVGLTRSDVFITNAVKYRPTIGTNEIRNRTPRTAEWVASRPYLMRELDVFEGTPVIALGNVAMRTIQNGQLGKTFISHWHGRGWYDADRMYWAMYHPAYAVYDPSRTPVLLEDMALIMSHEEGS